MSVAAIMVQVDVERDCEQRVQLALDLADRFQAALIGVAGLPLRPAFATGGVVIYGEPTPHDYRMAAARFEEMGKKFCAFRGSISNRWNGAPLLNCHPSWWRGRQGPPT